MMENQEETVLVKGDKVASPMMQQWSDCKNRAKNAVLLFRMGDFYEAFYEDAALLAKELDLTLTKRQDIPMSGIPHHTCETYIDKLIAKGYCVAIAEQIEDPKKTKGLVKRDIVRIVTPGTLINSNLLSDRSNNFIASLAKVGQIFGLAFLDLTTGEFRVSEFKEERDLLNEIYRLRPTEFLTSLKFHEKQTGFFEEIRQNYPFLLNTDEDWHFEFQTAHDFLINHFKVYSLDGFGLSGMIPAVNAAGALLHYLRDNLCLPIDHIHEIRSYHTSHYMILDRMTQRNLELTLSLNDQSKKNTLLSILDQTLTPMGARLMQNWIKQPLLSVNEINLRQDGIHAFLNANDYLEQCRECLCTIRDLERLIMKISSGYATPKELMALHHSFRSISRLKEIAALLPAEWIQNEARKLDDLSGMNQLIVNALVDDPPMKLGEGRVFREGYHSELDELREISHDSKTWMARYQMLLRDQTGIKTLKVGFNKMFGYFIEVSRGQSEKMPETFTRRQTLVNAERYITPELKEYESKVLTAEERIKVIENELFYQLRSEIAKFTKGVLFIAKAIAQLDCLASLALVAKKQHYIRPSMNDQFEIKIEEAPPRH